MNSQPVFFSSERTAQRFFGFSPKSVGQCYHRENNPLGFSSNVRANQIISNVSIHSLLSFLYFSLFSHSIFLLLTAALQCIVSMWATSQQLPTLHWQKMLADLLDNPAHFVFTLAHLARRWPEGNFPLLWPGPRLTNITAEELSFFANVVSRDTATSGENQRTPARLRIVTHSHSVETTYHIHECVVWPAEQVIKRGLITVTSTGSCSLIPVARLKHSWKMTRNGICDFLPSFRA